MFLNKTVNKSSLFNQICSFLNKTVNKSSLLNFICIFLNKTVNKSSLLNFICIFLNKTVNKSSLLNCICIFLNKTLNKSLDQKKRLNSNRKTKPNSPMVNSFPPWAGTKKGYSICIVRLEIANDNALAFLCSMTKVIYNILDKKHFS